MTRSVLEGFPIHLTLLDPDEQSPKEAGEMAASAGAAGTDGIMVGGSIGSVGDLVENTVSAVKDSVDVPVVLFPQDHGSVAPNADALFFMSMLNSRNPMYISGFQMMGAPMVAKYGLESLSMAYLPVEPAGETTVGFVSDAKPIPQEKTDVSVAYSLAAQFMGMEYVYLEAGSGAEEPVPVEMVAGVSRATDVNVVVGGGLRSPESVAERVAAGADVIVTGTAVEGSDDVERTIASFVEGVERGAGKRPELSP